jgi:hypothetical protein
MLQKTILGFSGRKSSGKDTAVSDIVKRLPFGTVDVLPIAAGLKDIVRRCFVPAEWPQSKTIHWTERDKQMPLPCGKTLREILQLVGTDWFRQLWSDVWVNAWKAEVSRSSAEAILVPDVRFPNELAAIQDMNGHVIRLTRAPYIDAHVSETSLDVAEYDTAHGIFDGPTRLFDAIVDNRSMSIEQQNAAVLGLVRQKGWVPGI